MELRKGVRPEIVPLDIRHDLILYQRYSLHWTFAEVGKFWGVSRQRIQQITSEFEQAARQWAKGTTLFEAGSYSGPGLP